MIIEIIVLLEIVFKSSNLRIGIGLIKHPFSIGGFSTGGFRLRRHSVGRG